MPIAPNGIDGQRPLRLEVRLLGGVEIILDGQRLRAFNAVRLQRILALLVLRREPQHRGRLAFELWPDSDEAQARTNLRKLLHELRQALPDIGEFVEIDKASLRWIPAGPSRVDVLRFHDAVAAGDLELAARLYAGDLLPACYDDWVLEERARLHAEACRVLIRLAEEAAGREDHGATIGHARRVSELEPTDEAAVRLQMQAHVALDDRAAALRAYHRHAEALERDLALAPGAAMVALYRQLRAAGTNGGESADPNLPAAAAPFVGRDGEWTVLTRAWNRAIAGEAHLVLLSGEAGIGKSRLAQELGRQVQAGGHLLAAARAYEAAGRLPWGPVVDLLRAEAFRGVIATLDAAWRAELARLLPELGEPEPAASPGASSDPAQRHRLFDAVSRALLAGDRPRLLIIDDLQWCDVETVELIGFLIRAGPDAPLLIVGTVRTEEIPEQHPLPGLRDALERDRTVTSIALERLDEQDTATLAARLRGEDAIDPVLAARLWRETEGNPLFVIEALRAGITPEQDQAVLTPTMRAILRARLGQLSTDARQLAAVAAVIGRAFPVRLLAAASGLDERRLLDPVDELWRRRIIRDQGSAYDFSHDKLRAVALDMISPAWRRQLHRAVAEAIAQAHGDAASAQLAAHYDQAGLADAAIASYHRAGTRAVAVAALEEAVSLFQRALSLLAELPASADRDALELDIRVALGSPYVALEGYGARTVHRLYERARSLCRRLQRPVDPPILRGLGLARLQGCRFDESSQLGQALLDHESRDPSARTEGRYLLGVNAFWRGELGSARAQLQAALDSYAPSLREHHLAWYAQDPKAICLVRLALAELWAGDAEQAAARADAALELARDLDHPMTSAYVHTYAAMLAAESEDRQRLAATLADAERLWKRLADRYLVILLDALRGWQAVCDGSTGGIDAILHAAARSRRDGQTLHLSYCLLLLARARGLSGEYPEGRAATREALAWTRRWRQRYLEAELWRADGELAYRGGNREAAATSLQAAVETAAAQGANWLQLRALHALASRFPERGLQPRLAELVAAIPSGHDLPPLRSARELLGA